MKSLTSRAFLPINTDLFNNPKYQELSCDAMILYSLYS
ncbi:replication protein, partial [Lactobacillus salivarius]|nr:replication protein [Ligilactobacillus salivarius]